MITRDFTLPNASTAYGKPVRANVEEFVSPTELFNVVHSRTLVWSGYSDGDYASGMKPPNPSWAGFSSAEKLWSRLTDGTDDTRLVGDIRAEVQRVRVDPKSTRIRVNSVVGGSVNTQRYLSGSPRCMTGSKRVQMPSRFINVGILSEVSSNKSKESYTRVGACIARATASLELAGYRVGLKAISAFNSDYDDERGNLGAYESQILILPVKGVNEPMNLARIVFPLTDISFFRGVGFAWQSRKPGMYLRYARGEPSSHIISSSYQDEFIRKACGSEQTVTLNISTLIGMSRGWTDAKLYEYVRGRFLGEEAKA